MRCLLPKCRHLEKSHWSDIQQELGKCRVKGCDCPVFMGELGNPEQEKAVYLGTEVILDLAKAGRRYPVRIREDYKLELVVGAFVFVFASWKTYEQIKERGYRPKR